MNTVHRVPGKERTRGPGLAVLVNRNNSVPMEETLLKADVAGAVIASNMRLSRALVGSEEWQSIRGAFPCWSGTMAGYDNPGRKLGEKIEYVDPQTGIRYVFPVPPRYRGMKDVILVVEHPNFTLKKDGNARIVVAKDVDVVTDFPISSPAWYPGDPIYDIPHGQKKESSRPDERYLWRSNNSRRVGLVVRDYNYCLLGLGAGQQVDICTKPSHSLGVIIEAASVTSETKSEVTP